MGSEISDVIGVVVDRWMASRTAAPLVVQKFPDGTVECRMGFEPKDRLNLRELAEFFGVSDRTLRRHNFYGLKRAGDKRFSKLQAYRVREVLRHGQ